MSDLAPRPRSATELVDAAFQLYRRSPMQLILAAALIYVPWLIVRLILTATTGIGTLGVGPAGSLTAPSTATSPGSAVGYLLIALGTMVIYGLVDAATLRIASELYVGRELDAMDALKSVAGRLVLYVWIGIGRSVGVGLASIFFIVPGVYLYAKWAVAIPVAVLEGAGERSSFARSGELSKGLKWHILLTMLLVMIIYFVATGAMTAAAVLTGSKVVVQVINTVMVIAVYPLVGLTTTLLYYDLRIRREGYDIELMAAMSAADPVTGPAPA